MIAAVRALAVLLLALAALVAVPGGSGSDARAADSCTTAFTGGESELRDGPTADACASAILIVTPNPALPGAVVRLDGSQSEGGDLGDAIDTYVWDFGDGDDDVTAAPASSTTHTYARGRYTASLSVENASGDELADTAVDVIVSVAPVASLTGPGGVLRPNVDYTFDASGSTAPGAPGDLPDRYVWNWGDGTTDTTTTPVVQHAFDDDGASTQVTVTVVNDLGLASAPAAHAVTVANQLPLVQLLATPATIPVGGQVTLDAGGSSDPDGSITRFQWDLDANGSFETDTGMTTSVTAGGFPNPGQLVLRVRVTDDSRRASVKSVVVTVTGAGGGLGPGGGSGRRGGSGGGSGSDGSGDGAGSGGSGAGGAGGAGFTVGLGGSAIQQLRTALRRGVGLTASANRSASGTLTLTVTAADARKLGLSGRRGRAPVAIGTLRLSLRAGRTAKPSIKLRRGVAQALRRARPSALRVTIRGRLAAGAASAAVVRVVLLRG